MCLFISALAGWLVGLSAACLLSQTVCLFGCLLDNVQFVASSCVLVCLFVIKLILIYIYIYMFQAPGFMVPPSP